MGGKLWKASECDILIKHWARWHVSQQNFIYFLKNFAIKHKLPVLERKWDKINVDKKTFYDIAKLRKVEALKFFAEGFTREQVGILLGVTAAATFRYINKADYAALYETRLRKNLGADVK